MTSSQTIEMAAGLVLIVGPLLLGAVGLIHAHRARANAGLESTTPWNWKLTTMSALLYTLAFNLTFLIQELFLVLPKALTPGLRPTLFHNNHSWEGVRELASLFQGTGVLSILLTGIGCALLLGRVRSGSTAVRLWFFWMAYCGLFMALPQVIMGAISPRSDMGMAMAYMGLGETTKALAALVALAAVPLLALRLRYPLLDLAGSAEQAVDARARTFLVFEIATLPTLMAIPLIIAFRVPREWIEVVMVPVVVSLIGVAWIQAGAWSATRVGLLGSSAAGLSVWPLGAVIFLLLIFQLLLRPGIRFY